MNKFIVRDLFSTYYIVAEVKKVRCPYCLIMHDPYKCKMGNEYGECPQCGFSFRWTVLTSPWGVMYLTTENSEGSKEALQTMFGQLLKKWEQNRLALSKSALEPGGYSDEEKEA